MERNADVLRRVIQRGGFAVEVADLGACFRATARDDADEVRIVSAPGECRPIAWMAQASAFAGV